MAVEPLHDGESAGLLDDGSKMIGGDAELVGIELYLTLTKPIQIDEAEKLVKDFVLSRGCLLAQVFLAVGKSLQFQEQGSLQVGNDLGLQGLVSCLVPHQLDVFIGQPPLVVIQCEICLLT